MAWGHRMTCVWGRMILAENHKLVVEAWFLWLPSRMHYIQIGESILGRVSCSWQLWGTEWPGTREDDIKQKIRNWPWGTVLQLTCKTHYIQIGGVCLGWASWSWELWAWNYLCMTWRRWEGNITEHRRFWQWETCLGRTRGWARACT